jgi:DNA-directed RNA polymerase II subunit RPB2
MDLLEKMMALGMTWCLGSICRLITLPSVHLLD